MNQPELTSALQQSARPRRRRWRRLLAGAALLLGLCATYVLLLFYVSGRNLRSALAEADSSDPGWRLHELEAKRPFVADADNAALRVLAADKLLPAAVAPPSFFGTAPFRLWPEKSAQENEALQRALEGLAPAEPLQREQAAALTAMLSQLTSALQEARRLADLPAGRFPAAYQPEPPPSRAASVPAARRVAQLLGCDVLLRAEQNDPDGALASCRALLNTARSIGDEPLSFSQIVRMQLREDCCRKIERALAQGEPSEQSLAALQHLLEMEASEPLFLIGARGQRAEWDNFLESLQEGDFGQTTLRRSFFAAMGRTTRPSILRVTTRIVEIARLPLEEQGPRLRQPDLFAVNRLDFLARVYLLPRVEKITSDLYKGQVGSSAELRCAIAALAAERYRRHQGRWPESLAALLPRYLTAVPVDPFDKLPLRLRADSEGLVIYSVGPDGQDDGGHIDRNKPGPGTDLGFQLWDPGRRHRALARSKILRQF